jgi:hypothetical protein
MRRIELFAGTIEPGAKARIPPGRCGSNVPRNTTTPRPRASRTIDRNPLTTDGIAASRPAFRSFAPSSSSSTSGALRFNTVGNRSTPTLRSAGLALVTRSPPTPSSVMLTVCAVYRSIRRVLSLNA